MKKLNLIVGLLFPLISFCQIIYIPSDYPTIQEGINASNNGDTVLVDVGTYVENVNFYGKNITVASNYLTTLDTSYISQTIIDGNSIGTVVTFENGENSTTCLCGFTIVNGRASCLSISYNSGGGIYCYNGSPKLIHLHVIQNISICDGWENNSDNCPHGKGGGLYFENSNSQIRSLKVTDNYAHIGGGVCCINSNITIEKTFINNNDASGLTPRSGGRGAGLAIIGSEIVLINSALDFNNAYGNSRGGGIFSQNSNTKLINVKLNNNYSTSAGDGIWCSDGGSLELLNVLMVNSMDAIELSDCIATLTNVSLSNSFRAIRLRQNAIINLQNSILWNNNFIAIEMLGNYGGNDITIQYSNIEDGENGINTNGGGTLHWLEGNINEDPVFEGYGDHPFQLSAESPCIDAGTPDTTGLNLPQFDIICNKRIWDGDNNGSDIIDMGAYEYGSIPVGFHAQIINRSPSFNIKSYPNPFTSEATLEYELNQSLSAHVFIYNELGTKVMELLNKHQVIGKNKLTIDLRDLKPGVYFCTLQTQEGIQTKKIIKLN